MMKKTFLKILCFVLIISFIPLAGCSKFEDFKENMASRSAQRKEDEKRSFSTMHEFEDYYAKEIKSALKDKKKSALKELFCETVLENTYDMDEGLKYVFGLEDWSDFSFSNGNCSSRKEYGTNIWEFVFCHMDISKDNVRYRLFYSGYSRFTGKVDGKNGTVKENLGLANLYIVKLDFKGKVENEVYNAINGIHHPGREKIEAIAYTVLDTYESKNKDGSYIDTMTDEAIDSLMTDNLRNSADKDELEAFIRFIRYGSMSKKGEYFFFLSKNGKDVTLTNVVHFKLDDHCLTMLIKNDQIDGVTFSDDENPEKPQSGRIKGFAERVE
ncbi:MAG: DUF5104 domain-containing protein [Clostridiales bacterium]|nr:DUF5104 domain-containing protein [Clostridiales bacterium]